LLVTAVHAEILFNGLVETFSLSISFWVVTGGVVNLCVQGLAQGTEEVGDEFGSAITSDMCGNSMFGYELQLKQTTHTCQLTQAITLLRKLYLGKLCLEKTLS
jgi:hypothetical protein